MQWDTQELQRDQQADSRRLQDHHFQSLSTNYMIIYLSSQTKPEIEKNINYSEYQQYVDLVKKFTNFKIEDNIFSNESSDVETNFVLSEAIKLSEDNKAKLFERIVGKLDTGLSRQELLKFMNEEIQDEKIKDELKEGDDLELLTKPVKATVVANKPDLY